jgi:hypothetical protein
MQSANQIRKTAREVPLTGAERKSLHFLQAVAAGIECGAACDAAMSEVIALKPKKSEAPKRPT